MRSRSRETIEGLLSQTGSSDRRPLWLARVFQYGNESHEIRDTSSMTSGIVRVRRGVIRKRVSLTRFIRCGVHSPGHHPRVIKSFMNRAGRRAIAQRVSRVDRTPCSRSGPNTEFSRPKKHRCPSTAQTTLCTSGPNYACRRTSRVDKYTCPVVLAIRLDRNTVAQGGQVYSARNKRSSSG